MSEVKSETPETPPAAVAAVKPKAAEPAPLVLAIVVGAALVIGAGLGALLIAPRVIHARQAAAVAQAADPQAKHKDKKGKKDAKKKGKEGEGKAPVYRLENIIVNPANSGGQRFLMCSVAIVSDDSKALDYLRENEIELRDRVVTVLAGESLEALTAAGARDVLRGQLLEVIQSVLHEAGEEGQDVELKVYLPQFVIQ